MADTLEKLADLAGINKASFFETVEEYNEMCDSYDSLFYVVWKQKTNINGYQIAYSTSKKFTKKTTKYMNAGKKATKKTLKKLKAGKQYFVKVRTYRVLYNPATGKTEKIFGKWSNVKTFLARK